MRFVELRPTPEGPPLRLHPRITWLKGLDPAARVTVVGLAHDVALGQLPDWGGTVEIDGTVSDFADALARIGETADSALIIDAASLPAVVSLDVEDSDDPVDEEASLEAATAKLDDLNDRITGLAEELAASGTVRAEMTAQLTSALAQVDSSVFDVLDQADGALGRAARLANRPDPWTGMRNVPERIEELRAQVDALDVMLSKLPSGDRPALAAAVATARASLVTGKVPSPEAMALAQAWSSLHQRLRGLESRMEAAGGGTEAVAARLDEARRVARRAEDAAVPRKISQDESDWLGDLHEKMIQAEQKASRGVRRGAAKDAFDKAAKEFHDALDPLGYPTWAAYRMGNGMAAVAPEALAAHEKAQAELEAAELELAMLMARIERDTELQDVLSGIDRALEHATQLLGFDPQAGADAGDAGDADDPVMAALQSLSVDAASVGVGREAAAAHLREALAGAGAAGHESLTSDAAIVALGDSWIHVLMAADDLAVRLLRDRERAAEELEALEGLGDGSRVDRLDEERAAVHEAEVAVAQSREALRQVVEARLRLHMLAATELNLAEEHDDRLVQRESAELLVDLATRRKEGRAGADAAAALADRVPRGAAGPIPVVIVMGDAPAVTLDRLAVFPDDVQILVIGEGHGMSEWLEANGGATATEIDAGTLV
jgi:cob(I)alamin adenosyltransferase